MITYSPEALERGLRLTLMQRGGLQSADYVTRLAYSMMSDRVDEKHEWLGQPPQMSLFEGSRKFTALTATGYTITNKVYDASVRVSRDDLRRNQSGSIKRRVDELADVAMSFPDSHLTTTIINGTDATLGLCYDGTAFYGNSHTERADEGGTQDNLLAGTGSTVAQIQADISASISALRLVKAENGEPFHDAGLELCFMIPPGIETNFKTAVNATIVSNTSNQLVGIGEVIVNNRLSDVNDWYTFVKGAGKESLIFQTDQNIETDVSAEGSHIWKTDRQAEFGVSISVGAGYGLWQSSNKTVNS